MNRDSAARILGVSDDADDSQLKSAYKKQCLKWHPDRHSTKSEDEIKRAEEKFKQVSEAYEVMTKPPNPLDSFFNNGMSGHHQQHIDPFELFRQDFANEMDVDNVGHRFAGPGYDDTPFGLFSNIAGGIFNHHLNSAPRSPRHPRDGDSGMSFQVFTTDVLPNGQSVMRQTVNLNGHGIPGSSIFGSTNRNLRRSDRRHR